MKVRETIRPCDLTSEHGMAHIGFISNLRCVLVSESAIMDGDNLEKIPAPMIRFPENVVPRDAWIAIGEDLVIWSAGS